MPFEVKRSRLKSCLRAAGKRQKDLVMLLGVRKQKVSDWANNRIPIPFTTQKEIAEFLGCHIDDLWEWEEVPKKKKAGAQTE